VKTNYKQGDLVRFVQNNGWSICIPANVNGGYGKEVKEYVITAIPLDFFEAFNDLEEKLGLIVKVIRNKLEQPLGYQVQVGRDVLYFRSVLAEKYFRPVGEPTNESRGSR
tara:strand:+ start:1166 stop:1495 length:330 start_codon:yes stop_codon:yes gene_type:complete